MHISHFHSYLLLYFYYKIRNFTNELLFIPVVYIDMNHLLENTICLAYKNILMHLIIIHIS